MYKKIVDLIREIYQSNESIHLHEPVFGDKEKKYLADCIDTTFVSSVGRYVDEFEKKLEEYTGSTKVVACVNGTNALHLALLLLGVTKEDEVITQALSFVATSNAISYICAHPVFIDVDIDTMGLSPTAMEKWLSMNTELKNGNCYNKKTGRKIKACVPMHTFGHPSHLDKIVEVCKNYHLELIEDAAESLGSFYKGRHTGTYGKVGVLSFNGNKIITTGGGGALLFNDIELAKQAKHLSTQAKVPHKWEFFHDKIGFNYRMPNVNAALGCAQLEKLDFFVANKRKIAMIYKSFFEKQSEIKFFSEPDNCRSNFWLNALLFKDEDEKQKFLTFSNENGIMTRPLWNLITTLPMYQNCQKGDLTNSESFAKKIVNIPSGVSLKI